MANSPKYYLVEASALPEVFLKVAEAKRMLSTGEAATVNEATRMTGISRSAFYKYRDSVLPFQNMMAGRIVTFQFRIYDEPGVLSTILQEFAKHEVNLLTINSMIPANGCAVVTVSAETSGINISLEDLLHLLEQTFWPADIPIHQTVPPGTVFSLFVAITHRLTRGDGSADGYEIRRVVSGGYGPAAGGGGQSGSSEGKRG